MFKALVVLPLLFSTTSAFAGDRNFEPFRKDEGQPDKSYYEYGKHGHDHCQRFMLADLDGLYVTWQSDTRKNDLVLFTKAGDGAYIVSQARFELAGYSNRSFSVVSNGPWPMHGDGYTVDRLSIRENYRSFQFSSTQFSNIGTSDNWGGVPDYHQGAVDGSILRPNGFRLGFTHIYQPWVQFRRVELNRAFEVLTTRSLKSLLARSFDNPENALKRDNFIVIDMNVPMTIKEARELLNVIVVPIDGEMDPERRSYKFLMNYDLYAFLQKVNGWLEHWQVGTIDTIPAAAVSENVLKGFNQ